MRFPDVVCGPIALALICGCASWHPAQAAVPIESEYSFVADTSRYVGIFRNHVLMIGKLDSSGNFWPDPRYLNVRNQLGRLPGYVLLNPGDGRPVYEYRSGRLIPGRNDGSGSFVPDLGGKIISFKDYRYSPGARRIYNLPGRFIKKQSRPPKK